MQEYRTVLTRNLLSKMMTENIENVNAGQLINNLPPTSSTTTNHLSYTENKKGTVPNLKRFRILKRILNLFRFRTTVVRYKTHFSKSRNQVPQNRFYITDVMDKCSSRYGNHNYINVTTNPLLVTDIHFDFI